MIDLAVLTIDSKRIKLFIDTFYYDEENRIEEIKNTNLHLFIDTRNVSFDILKKEIEEHRKKVLPDLNIIFYKDMHKYLIHYFQFTEEDNKDSIDYINNQIHHIKMSIPLILQKEKYIDKLFFMDDDVILLRSPKKYFEKEYNNYISVMVRDAFTRFDPKNDFSKREFNAFLCNTNSKRTVEEQNKMGIMSVGQFLFNYVESYPIFLRKFYTNDFIQRKFFTKVFDRNLNKVIARGRIHASFLDEQKALSMYLQQFPMGKFERGDICIYFEKPEKFVKKGLDKKVHKNMLVHYGNSNKEFYINHFSKQYLKTEGSPSMNFNDYVIAIPSYKRSQTLIKKSLKALEFNGIDLSRVHVFVANEEEYSVYKNNLGNKFPGKIIVGEPTLKNVRNFITRYFPKDTLIYNMDDDVEGYRLMVRDFKGRILDSKFTIPTTKAYKGNSYDYFHKMNMLEEHIIEGFRLAKEYKTALFGMYPTTNSIGMSCDYRTKIAYIIGASWGCINPGDIFITVPDDKEDYERSILYYDRYKKIIRMNWIAPITNYYNEVGGMQEERTSERIKSCAYYLQDKYPEYCRAYLKEDSKGSFYELKLFDKSNEPKHKKLF